jgi:hypothetical protein
MRAPVTKRPSVKRLARARAAGAKARKRPARESRAFISTRWWTTFPPASGWNVFPGPRWSVNGRPFTLHPRGAHLDRQLDALRQTHADRRTRHRRTGKAAAHHANRLDPSRPGVVHRPPPVNHARQRGKLDYALVHEHAYVSPLARYGSTICSRSLRVRCLPSYPSISDSAPLDSFRFPRAKPNRADSFYL